MHQRRRLLLLVDNELARAERLARRLSHLNYDVQMADNGATGLLKAHEQHPDVVIAAADLPVLDGYRMLEALRSKPQTHEIPVLIMTDGNRQEEVAQAWQAGADLCIPMNQGEADVLATLHRALSSIHHGSDCSHAVAMVS
ncbi:MAG: response regulator [Actinomycetota bacterium]